MYNWSVISMGLGRMIIMNTIILMTLTGLMTLIPTALLVSFFNNNQPEKVRVRVDEDQDFYR